MKNLKTLLTVLTVSICAVQSAWAQEEQTITVSLSEPGGLATEIFAAQANQHYEQNVANVVNLTVTSGTLNDDDWTTLKTMTALKTLDISGTNNKDFPEEQFRGSCLNLEAIVFPSQLETIGEDAFYGENKLVTAILPSTLKDIGNFAFNGCTNLENIGSWPASATTIPRYCFGNCSKLQSFTIPEGVAIIKDRAFEGCSKFSSSIPSTVQSIDEEAFRNSSMQDVDVVLSEGITLGTRVFQNSGIRSIVLPSSYYEWINGYWPLSGCENLKDVTIMSPTVIGRGHNYSSGTYLGIPNSAIPNITLHVPDFLVNSYKSDAYFYQFETVGFDITQYDIVWPINYSLTLNSYTRMAGEPKIQLAYDVALTITGDAVQKFGEIGLNSCLYNHWIDSDYMYKNWSQILSTCDNVSVTGDYYQKINTDKGKWYFLCLPFDVDLSAITTDNDAKYAIRYYDGESRAYSNSSSGNWKNFAADDIIPAGTGFIYQTSQTTWTTFKAVQNDSRNNAFKTEEIILPLAANNETAPGNTLDAANKGWNLIGNPWQCYFYIQQLNYAAPICVYDGSTYVVYSIQDDDYVIEPNQAFFVQCPDALSSIGFPAEGRQLTSDVPTAQNARLHAAGEKSRWLLDIQIDNGAEQKDKTRLVVNNQALMDYEIGRDASKFMSMDNTVPQIYSLDTNGTQYAINERPLDKATMQLGIVIKENGQYTLSAVRNDIGEVLLTDHKTGITTDLSQHGYTFDAQAGTFDSRFTLSFMSDDVTGIQVINNNQLKVDKYYNLNGQRVDAPSKGIYVVNGKKVVVK